jgi:lipopolysaccharide biosynthesis regulator YciM
MWRNQKEQPGYYNGRHYSTYVSEIENLKKQGFIDQAEHLLLELVNATEAEAKANNSGVAPWYYEELAKIYRRRKDYQKEVAILERFAKQKHAPGVKPAQLLERLAKAKQLLASHL